MVDVNSETVSKYWNVPGTNECFSYLGAENRLIDLLFAGQ